MPMEKPVAKTSDGDIVTEGTKFDSFVEIESLEIHHRLHPDLHCTYHVIAWRNNDPQKRSVRIPALITRPRPEPDKSDYITIAFQLAGIADRLQAASRRLPGNQNSWSWALEAHCQAHLAQDPKVAVDYGPQLGETWVARSDVFAVSTNSKV